MALPTAVAGQESPGDEAAPRRAATNGWEDARWWNLMSQKSEQDRLVLGTWSFHYRSEDIDALANNWGFGVASHGFIAKVFNNSFGDWAAAVGIERAWLQPRWGPLGALLGFRAGVIYGYDGEFHPMAETLPVVPIGELVAGLRAGPFSTEVALSPLVVTFGGGLHF